jgi:uncharacterized membrane protein
MNLMFNILLVLHIIGGTLGLLAGTYITIAKKGDKKHKLVGKIFALSMLGAGFCSFILATLHRNDFLFAIGIFTVYMVSTGWRYLYLRDIAKGQKPLMIDWVILGFMSMGVIAFAYMGIRIALEKEPFCLVFFFFTHRSLSFILKDIKTYRGQISTKNYWLTHHFQRMMGAYIASLTAFAVVNAPERASILPWLVPAFIFIPLIIKWTRQYRIPMVNSEK